MRLLLHQEAATRAAGGTAWLHRVAAAKGADESLALALESAAAVSAPAGPGQPGSAQLLEWASDLSPDQDARVRRLLSAAIQRACAGIPGSPDLWTRVGSCPPSALRSCALAGRALLEGRYAEAGFHLNQAGAHDGQPAPVPAFAYGVRAALYSATGRGELAIAEAAEGLAEARGDRGLVRWLTRLLADGQCRTEGPGPALRTLAGLDEPAEPVTALAAGSYLVLAGQLRKAADELSNLADPDDTEVPAEIRASAWVWQALAFHLLGAWRDADRAAAAAQETRAPAARAVRALLAAHLADWGAAEEHLRHARASVAGSGVAGSGEDAAVFADLAEVAIAHAQGTAGAAIARHPALRRLAAVAGGHRALWLPYQSEALVRAGPSREAHAALAELDALGEQVPYLRVVHCRLAGMLAERDREPLVARRRYESAWDLPSACHVVPFQVGLLEQSYGRLLCALGEGAEGTAWTERARSSLLAAGSVAYVLRGPQGPPPGQFAAGILTEREDEVARLVMTGLTSQQVADRLFISARTVEYHLARIYGKLGVRSRRELTGRRLGA
jgi:DNA-binding CsgD family transcriptional regulator